MTLPFWDMPESRQALARLQSQRKRKAVENAMRSAFLGPRLRGIDLDRLDEPEVWNAIPILTKDELRTVPPDRFLEDFCIAPRSKIVEYWRSGGVTGRPLFYPRSAQDMREALGSFSRTWPLIGATQDDLLHCSFPLGIHPVASLFCRTAEEAGIGTVWAGAGNNTPSEIQIDLIQELKPTVWAGMGSYGIHLANLAEARGIDLSKGTVRKIIVAAEPLSAAKRQKLERSWNAEVFDLFGMTEGAFVAGEGSRREGHYIWSDLFFCEVVDEKTGQPAPNGTPGSLVVTPLAINEMTPFVRWMSGDIVTMHEQQDNGSPLSMFPILKHAGRTVGFFKVRGVNINHTELEDLMFFNPAVTDFKAEVHATEAGLDVLKIFAEPKPGADRVQLHQRIQADIARTFEMNADIAFLDTGTLGSEFEKTLKAARFIDRRNEQ